jgi:hypothetical protein
MRLSDVLACELHDAGGKRLGKVRDVRLVMDGPVRGSLAQLRLDALIVGGGALAGRLGYVRGNVRGPGLLRVVFSRLERRASSYRADQVDHWDIEHHRLQLKPDARAERDPEAR